MRLAAARCLLFWAVSVDSADFLPGSCLQHLLDALAPLYQQPDPQILLPDCFSSLRNIVFSFADSTAAQVGLPACQARDTAGRICGLAAGGIWGRLFFLF